MPSEPGLEQRTLHHKVGIRIVDERSLGFERAKAPKMHSEYVGWSAGAGLSVQRAMISSARWHGAFLGECDMLMTVPMQKGMQMK